MAANPQLVAEIEELAVVQPPDPAEPGGAVLSPVLQKALARLPDGQREAVQMVQVDGLSVAEAAARAGISTGALKVRAHRGYRSLRKALQGMDR